MTDSMGEKELLEALEHVYRGYMPPQEHAHTQLKAIIKWYFDEGIQQIVGDLKKTEGLLLVSVKPDGVDYKAEYFKLRAKLSASGLEIEE